MTIATQLFSFPSLTLAGAVEAFIAIKFFPEYWGPKGHLSAIGTLLAINNAFGVVFWTLLYPRLFSPLRRIPGPKVMFSPPGASFHPGPLTRFSCRRSSATPTAR